MRQVQFAKAKFQPAPTTDIREVKEAHYFHTSQTKKDMKEEAATAKAFI